MAKEEIRSRPLPMDKKSLRGLIRFICRERERRGITPKVEAGELGYFRDPVEYAWEKCLKALDGWDLLPPDLVRQVYKKYVEPTTVRR